MRRIDQPTAGVPPAHERLGAHWLAVGDRDDRLQVQLELPALDAAVHLGHQERRCALVALAAATSCPSRDDDAHRSLTLRLAHRPFRSADQLGTVFAGQSSRAADREPNGYIVKRNTGRRSTGLRLDAMGELLYEVAARVVMSGDEEHVCTQARADRTA